MVKQRWAMESQPAKHHQPTDQLNSYLGHCVLFSAAYWEDLQISNSKEWYIGYEASYSLILSTADGSTLWT